MRTSLHVEPSGAAATARHYIRDLVYGANDGIITTFAVVSGVAGGQLSQLAVLVVGAANLAADGVSMGVGNFLAIRADERARETEGLPELERDPWKHGLATLLAFVVARGAPHSLSDSAHVAAARRVNDSDLHHAVCTRGIASPGDERSLVADGPRDPRAGHFCRGRRVRCRTSGCVGGTPAVTQ